MSATMFKAVVWKELRENLKWAIFILLCTAAAYAYGIPSAEDLQRQAMDLNWISSVFEPTTILGGLLAGLLLGAAQTLVEHRGDKWGFLAHRPIDRTTLFWGKATAGILLYVISAGLPAAAALSWVALPEYLPVPFDWRIALPVIANLFCGLVFYFAGILTGMRQARWYASRALGIGAAFCCFVLQEAMAVEFWQAIVASTAGLAIVGTAAWSTFISGGQYDVQPRTGRIATGVSIGLGMTLVGWLAVVLSLVVLPRYQDPRGIRADWTSYVVTTDGAFVKVTRGSENRILEVSAPDGRPLEQYRNPGSGQALVADVVSATLTPELWTRPSFRSTSRQFSQLRRADVRNPVGWYYVDRLGLLAAYDGESRKLIGWMGPDGFSPGDAKPRPFAGRMIRRSSYGGVQNLLVFENAVYRIDLDRRHIEKAFETGPSETVLDMGLQQSSPSTLARFDEMAPFEVIWTTRRVVVQRRDGTKLLEAPQDAKNRTYLTLRVSRALRAPGSPIFLWYQDHLNESGQVYEFNSAGTLVNAWTLPATNAVPSETLPRIVVPAVIFPLTGQPYLESVIQRSRFESLTRPSGTIRWAAAILSSLVSAAAVFVWCRRYAFSPGRLSAWMGITFLLGPLGFLLMLALIDWPARESCPACSRKRVVTRDRCEHCGEPFAAPARDGTEIFEPVPAAHSCRH